MLIFLVAHLFIHCTESNGTDQTTTPVQYSPAELAPSKQINQTQMQLEESKQLKQTISKQLKQFKQTQSTKNTPITITDLINILKNPRILLDPVPSKLTSAINTHPACTDTPTKFDYESVSAYMSAGATCSATNNIKNNNNNNHNNNNNNYNTSCARKIYTIIKHGGTKLDNLFLLIHANIHSSYSIANSAELLFTDKCADKNAKNDYHQAKGQHKSLLYVEIVILAVLLCVILAYILFGGK